MYHTFLSYSSNTKTILPLTWCLLVHSISLLSVNESLTGTISGKISLFLSFLKNCVVNSAGVTFYWNYAMDTFYSNYAGSTVCCNYACFEVLLQSCRWYFLLQLCWWIFLLQSCRVTLSVAIIQLEVSAALIEVTVCAANIWVIIFTVIMQVGVSVGYYAGGNFCSALYA